VTQRSSFPGLAGAAPRSFFGRGSVGAPPPVVPDFALSNTTVATSWGIQVVGELIPINAPPGVIFRIKETPGATGDEADLAVVNG